MNSSTTDTGELVQVAVPREHLMLVYRFLADLESGATSSPLQKELSSEWTPELLRRAYEESPKSMKNVLSMLAAAGGRELQSGELASAVQLGAKRANLAGALGAFGRRVKSRYKMAEPPYATRWDADESRSYLTMPENYAHVLREYASPLDQSGLAIGERSLHLRFFRSRSQPAYETLFQNEGLDDVESLLTESERDGHSYEIIDTDSVDVDPLIGAAMVWAVFARTAIVPTFGSNKYKWGDFGKGVPALFVYDSVDDERPSAIYPHKAGDGYATIASFLTILHERSAASG